MKVTDRHISLWTFVPMDFRFCRARMAWGGVVFALCLLAASCTKEPSGIIPRREMEDILFDYHLTQGVLDIEPPEDRERNQRYLDAVFAKHGVTEAQFDTSMVYYTREGTMLKEMYASLNGRFKEMEERLKMQTGSDDMLLSLTASGDTANIWTGGSTVLLRPASLLCREVFSIRNDSTLLLAKDKIRLVANCVFFREVAEDRSSSLEVGITLEYESGKTTGMNRLVNSNSPIELSLEATEQEKIKALHGFFYYSGSAEARNLAFVTGIAIVRIHDKTALPPVEVATDSVAADSVVADSVQADSTVGVKERKHLTPEQLLQQSRTKERIEIKAAPDVRTKNSYGPRRKKSTSGAKNSRK